MDVREKLVELLEEFYGVDPMYHGVDANALADHLIAHGVTVQEWIPVKDKLPPYNRDVLVYRPNMAMKFLVDNYEGYYGEDDDEWLPLKCELLDACHNPCGVACWEQYLKYRHCKNEMEAKEE